jgi:7-cyano-7-deazaguanine synthase
MGVANPTGSVAVLVSGGVDSAVLLAETSERHDAVHPLYVRSGLVWEETELKYLENFMRAIARATLRPLKVLDVPVRDVYGDHWATTGRAVPDANSPDDAVYLPGRNVFLIGKAAVWCVLNDIGLLAVGSLKANPFGDSTPEFDDLMGQLIARALAKPCCVIRPFNTLSKGDVIRRGANLPLEWTFSCIHPVHDSHCGRCNKCAERHHGFRHAGVPDKTRYHQHPTNDP